MDQAQTAQGVVYGRVVDWFEGDTYGPLALSSQHGYMRANDGTRYQVRFTDIRGASQPPRKGTILRGIPEGARGYERVTHVEVA